MNRVEYLKFRRPYERVLRQLLLELDFFKEDFIGVNIHSVTSRLKDFDSTLKKSQRLKLAISELQDIAGIRIVVATLDEVDVVRRFFYRRANFNDTTIKSDRLIDKKDGYRAKHLVLEFTGHYSRSVIPTLVEVQIVTLLQHTFNYISRAWTYKTELPFSDEWIADFRRLSSDISDIDRRIAQLQNEVSTAFATAGDDEPLTPFSYQKIIADMFGESETLDNTVDDVRRLIDLGYDTNGELKKLFSNSDVLDLREQFLDLGARMTDGPVKRLISDVAVHRFFVRYGLNLDAARELLQGLTEIERE